MRAFCAILLVALAIVVHANEQTVGVKGTLWCGKEPIPHSDVQLLVHDTFSDNVLMTVSTNGSGYFQLTGSRNKAYSMRTYVKFFFFCNPNNAKPDPNAKCTRVVRADLPDNIAIDGKNPKWYDMPNVVMKPDGKMPNEDQDCKN
ncbi:hypothetical protein PRIPAC_76486 [Pristionchus pacificus]|uniref:Uncharacterized protein n=1 Tax=Pristionchus pacificus TaxID=54126 RepID=A0A454XN43_PRIPA|nr:hypothetical protein PRIPAC_76486 [Pristionchus pacificus]|eukprot:PDM71285.1 hypothetical protein PRIPAC_37692 [Pristionchus pacificus]